MGGTNVLTGDYMLERACRQVSIFHTAQDKYMGATVSKIGVREWTACVSFPTTGGRDGCLLSWAGGAGPKSNRSPLKIPGGNGSAPRPDAVRVVRRCPARGILVRAEHWHVLDVVGSHGTGARRTTAGSRWARPAVTGEEGDDGGRRRGR